MAPTSQQPPARLLSQQVREARYFFLNLARPGRAALTVAFGGSETCNPDYLIARSRFDYFGVEYVAQGEGSVVLDGVRSPLRPGSVFAYGRRTRCEIRSDPGHPLVKYFVCFGGSRAARVLSASGVPAGRVLSLAAHAEVRSVLEELIVEGQRGGPEAPEISRVLVELLLLRVKSALSIARRGGVTEPARESFLRCKALIDADAATLMTLRDIASKAGVESSTLCRLFRRYQGTSPYQYLLRRKMAIAASYLVEKGGLVKEAALTVGFADPYHFSRCFKAIHGVAPRALLLYKDSNQADG